MKPNKEIQFMSKVAEDIIKVKWRKLVEKGHETCWRKFYSIMKKHGIKQGTMIKGGGRQCNNPEWVMCTVLFTDRIISTMMLEEVLADSVPKVLEAY